MNKAPEPLPRSRFLPGKDSDYLDIVRLAAELKVRN
jgi:hypothetical protein